MTILKWMTSERGFVRAGRCYLASDLQLCPVVVSVPDLQSYGDFWLNVIGPPTLVAGFFGISRTVNSVPWGGRTFVVCWEKVPTDPTRLGC